MGMIGALLVCLFGVASLLGQPCGCVKVLRDLVGVIGKLQNSLCRALPPSQHVALWLSHPLPSFLPRLFPAGDDASLGEFTPAFLWLLRDFYLKLEEDGHKVVY